MSTVKITQLPELLALNANTSNTYLIGVDVPSGITGKFTTKTLSKTLYLQNPLNVGTLPIILPNTIAQFANTSNNYVQINLVNESNNGTADYVVTANTGSDTSYYIDLGYTNSNFPSNAFNGLGSSTEPLSGYLYVQGLGAGQPGGNLTIGTTVTGTETRFISGGVNADSIIVRINNNAVSLTREIVFGDGSIQNTAAVGANYSQAAYAYANTVNAYAYYANTWLQANDAATLTAAQANAGAALAASKVYTDTANTFLQSNDTITLSSAKSYTDVANTWLQANDASTLSLAKANAGAALAAAKVYTDTANTFIQTNYLANTTGTFNGDLTFTGNINAVGVNSITSLNSIRVTGNNGTTTVSVNNSSYPAQTAPVQITASNGYIIQPPSNDGTMLHITGKEGIPSRIVIDSTGGNTAYAIFTGRSSRGTAAAPSAKQAGDPIVRIVGNAYGATKYSTLGDARIQFVAAENFTDIAKGTQIEFWTNPIGGNTMNNIATFTGNTVTFSGYVAPQNGFIFVPRIQQGAQSAITIDYTKDSVVRATFNTTLTISHSNFVSGKVVEMWLTNTAGNGQTIVHGALANNSTSGTTSFSIPASSTAYLRYFCLDGDLNNVFVTVAHA